MKKGIISIIILMIAAIFAVMPCFGEFYETYGSVPGNNVVRAQTVTVSEITDKDGLDAILAGTLPTTVILYVDGSMNVTAGRGGETVMTVTEAVAKLGEKVMPAFYVCDEASAEAIGNYAKEIKFKDSFVISDNASLVAKAHGIYPMHGIIDFRKASEEELEPLNVRNVTNVNMAKIALVPEDYSYGNISWLQKRIITVWTEASDDEFSCLDRIISGANGVVCNNPETFYGAMTKLSPDTLLRNPNLIGHRGQPATNHENTLSSAIAAYEAGADAIECDVYFSKDKQIVIMHDEDISRTTNGTGSITKYTLEELKQFKMDTNPSFADDTIPTLREYFEYFKDKEIMQVIEIKTGAGDIIPALKELIDEYDMSSKVNFISFNAGQLKKAREQMPEISSGLLVSVAAANNDERSRTTVISGIMKNNLSYHPSVQAMSDSFVNWAIARGISAYPWTIDDGTTFVTAYLNYESVTTNHALYASGFAVSVKDIDVSTLKADSEGNLTVSGRLVKRTGEPENVTLSVQPLCDKECYKISKDGSVKIISEEPVGFLASYDFENTEGKLAGAGYTLYAQPFRIAKEADDGKNSNIGKILIPTVSVAAAAVAAAVVTVIIKKNRKKTA